MRELVHPSKGNFTKEEKTMFYCIWHMSVRKSSKVSKPAHDLLFENLTLGGKAELKVAFEREARKKTQTSTPNLR